MEDAFEKLGINFSREEIGEVFQESDMRENGRLDFKEFLVCLAIGFVLHVCAIFTSEPVFYILILSMHRKFLL
jgi:calcium-binding protein CML